MFSKGQETDQNSLSDNECNFLMAEIFCEATECDLQDDEQAVL